MVIAVLLLTSCADYTPTEKSVTNSAEYHQHYALHPQNLTLGTYALEAMDRQLRSYPRALIQEATLQVNHADISKTNDYALAYHLLWSYGLTNAQITQREVIDGNAPALRFTLRVKEASIPPRCPDWRHSGVVNHDNSVMSNHGCATATNLYHMVKDQRDLLVGRGKIKAVTESATQAVELLYSRELIPPTPREGGQQD